ncbi:hypothetical protein BDP27DRAFT_1450779 [Rhodocollybia butyracea]|uniref:Uncharacterized protein n=1 Tax=Rhodocollybia butyracea TaxID=206335 RepID=A0A9P5PJG4_9AGAR|nr:hypothetical protein BDP27DRAFT_1450779 [Rhodocollybia butyracea]
MIISLRLRIITVLVAFSLLGAFTNALPTRDKKSQAATPEDKKTPASKPLHHVLAAFKRPTVAISEPLELWISSRTVKRKSGKIDLQSWTLRIGDQVVHSVLEPETRAAASIFHFRPKITAMVTEKAQLPKERYKKIPLGNAAFLSEGDKFTMMAKLEKIKMKPITEEEGTCVWFLKSALELLARQGKIEGGQVPKAFTELYNEQHTMIRAAYMAAFQEEYAKLKRPGATVVKGKGQGKKKAI